ncbi:Repressible alkaline phosphatase [Smittium mucronatum]|uniref:alkaline phosphatase n=1 Tax=Smittium mucronatum TaxID=133383 RepID=A0A1R0GSS8_9FUNG|nr:Repressible alkaline phosphatase [Smittium mucronatum]
MKFSILYFATLLSVSALPANPKKNLIFMVSDGFGPASETAARDYIQQSSKFPETYMTDLDKLLIGSSRTRSADSFVTDSAAGAVVFASGVKTYNLALGVDRDGKPIGTNMEAAHRLGYKTGVVVKSRITDATPAAFASHVLERGMGSLIAEQMAGLVPAIGRNLDLMFGGGKCMFMPNTTTGSCRADTLDVISEMSSSGWSISQTRDEFNNIPVDAKLPIAGMYALDNVPYSIDYPVNNVPSLPEMAKKALSILAEASKDSEHGFYVLIEGSRIDHAGHDNDLGTHIREIIEYYETIRVVSEFIDANPNTVMVSTSDHETGGLGLGRDNKYVYYPLTYQNQTKSIEQSCLGLLNLPLSQRGAYVTEQMLPVHLGISNVTESVASAVLASTIKSQCLLSMSAALSRDSNILWSTLGHTGVDVNLYAKGATTEQLSGCHENTDIGKWLTNYLNVNIDAVTKDIANISVAQYPYTRNPSTFVYENYSHE